MKEIIGQIIGAIAVIIFFYSYQVKNQKVLLISQTLATSIMCIHYLLLGATTGLIINIVCIIRNVLYYFKEFKFLSSRILPYLLAGVMVVLGVISWEGYYSLFLIVGLAVNTICLSMKSTQKIRYSILITCPLVLTYNVFCLSIGGIVNESVSIISAIIGIIRCLKKRKERNYERQNCESDNR